MVGAQGSLVKFSADMANPLYLDSPANASD
jgi:hypothetical protein